MDDVRPKSLPHQSSKLPGSDELSPPAPTPENGPPALGLAMKLMSESGGDLATLALLTRVSSRGVKVGTELCYYSTNEIPSLEQVRSKLAARLQMAPAFHGTVGDPVQNHSGGPRRRASA